MNSIERALLIVFSGAFLLLLSPRVWAETDNDQGGKANAGDLPLVAPVSGFSGSEPGPPADVLDIEVDLTYYPEDRNMAQYHPEKERFGGVSYYGSDLAKKLGRPVIAVRASDDKYQLAMSVAADISLAVTDVFTNNPEPLVVYQRVTGKKNAASISLSDGMGLYTDQNPDVKTTATGYYSLRDAHSSRVRFAQRVFETHGKDVAAQVGGDSDMTLSSAAAGTEGNSNDNEGNKVEATENAVSDPALGEEVVSSQPADGDSAKEEYIGTALSRAMEYSKQQGKRALAIPIFRAKGDTLSAKEIIDRFEGAFREQGVTAKVFLDEDAEIGVTLVGYIYEGVMSTAYRIDQVGKPNSYYRDLYRSQFLGAMDATVE